MVAGLQVPMDAFLQRLPRWNSRLKASWRGSRTGNRDRSLPAILARLQIQMEGLLDQFPYGISGWNPSSGVCRAARGDAALRVGFEARFSTERNL